MAFGITRNEMLQWKKQVEQGEIAYLTHFWHDERFPQYKSVTKVGCCDLVKLAKWCNDHGIDPVYIHRRERYPHMDLMGSKQHEILLQERQYEQIKRFLS